MYSWREAVGRRVREGRFVRSWLWFGLVLWFGFVVGAVLRGSKWGGMVDGFASSFSLSREEREEVSESCC